MKKNIPLFIAIILIASPLGAQESLNSVGIHAGIGMELFLSQGPDNTQPERFFYDHFGIFADLTYVNMNLEFGLSSGVPFTGNPDFDLSSINLGLLGKYPFRINEKTTLSAGLGASFFKNLSFLDKGTGTSKRDLTLEQQGMLDSFFVDLGIIIDQKFTAAHFFRFSILAGYNLKLLQQLDNIANAPQGIFPRASFGIGLRI